MSKFSGINRPYIAGEIEKTPQEKQKEPHLGMGLHIARLIAEYHGGSIRAENRIDIEGVSIGVVFPKFYK